MEPKNTTISMNLNDSATYQELDTHDMRGSIALLPQQIKQTWDEMNKLDIPNNFESISSVVFSGMGGSALGAHVAKHLYAPLMTIPFEVVNDYFIPQYVNDKSLVVIQSYSGTTEETLSSINKAYSKKAKIFVIATGEKLLDEAIKLKVPYFQINPLYNPSNQPRMGIGYSIFSLLALLNKMKIIQILQEEIDKIIESLVQNNQKYGIIVPQTHNFTKQLAEEIKGKIPIFITGGHLIGSIHATRNQFNENAKTMSFYFPIPEADHHILEAFQFPTNLNETVECVFYLSSHFNEIIIKRIDKTAAMIKDLGIPVRTIKFNGQTKLEEVMDAIHMGSYLSFYSALLNGIDPTPIPNVESFKEELRDLNY